MSVQCEGDVALGSASPAYVALSFLIRLARSVGTTSQNNKTTRTMIVIPVMNRLSVQGTVRGGAGETLHPGFSFDSWSSRSFRRIEVRERLSPSGNDAGFVGLRVYT